MRRILIILLLPLFLFSAGAEERDQLFNEAVSAYAAGDYGTSLEIFRKIEAQGLVSWELYYNIGNAHYRSGNLGKAIQYWEKAALLAPAQKDIAYNLGVARDRLADKVVLPEMFPLFRWYADLQKRIPLNAAVSIIGFMFAALLLFHAVSRLYRRLRGRSNKVLLWSVTGVLGALLILLSFVTIDTALERRNLREAIILSQEAQAFSEPDIDAPRLFYLHEGSKVRILKEIEDDWAQISYFDDKVGWMRLDQLGKIRE